IRGGSFNSGSARSADRSSSGPAGRYNYHYGFRIARALPLKAGAPTALPAPVTRAKAEVAAEPPQRDFALRFGGKSAKPFAVEGWNYRGDTPLTIEAWITPEEIKYQSYLGNGKQGGLRLGMQTAGWEFAFQREVVTFVN